MKKTLFIFGFIFSINAFGGGGYQPPVYWPMLSWELNSGAGIVKKIVINTGGFVYLEYKSSGITHKKTIGRLDTVVTTNIKRIVQSVPRNLKVTNKTPTVPMCANASVQNYYAFGRQVGPGIIFYSESGCHNLEPEGKLSGYLLEIKSILDSFNTASSLSLPSIDAKLTK